MDKAEKHPLRDQPRLAGNHAVQERTVWQLRLGDLGIVPGNCIVGELPQRFYVASCGKILEGAYAKMARCDSGEHGPEPLS